MPLRFQSLGTIVCMCIFLVKDKKCHSLDLQRYPAGITAIEAINKCGAAGIENDPLVLSKLAELHGQEFWTGLGIFTQLTPWIEIIGCFLLQFRPTEVFYVSSTGLCNKECSTEYFGYNKVNRFCTCFENSEILLTRKTNLSSCRTAINETVLIYKIYNGTITSSVANNGLCSTLSCIHPDLIVMHEEHCKGMSHIEEDGMPSSMGQFWGRPQIQTFESCWNQNKLLLSSNACPTFTPSAWTNVFREEIEVELKLGDRAVSPKLCLSVHITTSDHKGENILTMHHRNCSTKLEWFTCKEVFVTVRNEYHTDEAKYSSYDAVIGGVLGACSMIAVLVVLIVCKVRSKGIFAESNTQDYEDTSHVNFSTTTYDDLDSTKHTNTTSTSTSNRTFDIDESSTPVYEEVNKN
ncbi:unnamed protein product [Mytilus edulis]|uniref:Uncharacterized protein n=1 Tax=Mytilus edulis TaxID=6550 RepID=A0A8S3UAE8_MYTED|nr:unnamed protein product [Mytilus edulis]